MKRHAVAVVALALLAFPAVAGAGKIVWAGKIVYRDTLPKNGSRQITVKVAKPAAFRVLMRTSTQGRTRLYLLRAHAPKGGPLIDTKTYKCEGAAGSWYCKGAYEPLPAGTYTFTVVFTSSVPTNPGGLSLTVNW